MASSALEGHVGIKGQWLSKFPAGRVAGACVECCRGRHSASGPFAVCYWSIVASGELFGLRVMIFVGFSGGT